MPSWSYSSLTKFETCARQYAIIKVYKRVKETQGEEMKWGNAVHKMMEERVRDGIALPDNCQKWEPLAKKLENMNGEKFFEQEFSFNELLEPVGWWDETSWCRGKLDFWVKKGSKAIVYDYKTGKIKKDLEQMRLFAAFVMQAHPEIETVETGYIWLAHAKINVERFTRADLPVIWNDFAHRARRLNMAYDQDKWVPNPSGLCKGWCPVGRTECNFWSPKV
jgi:hypothetical protein